MFLGILFAAAEQRESGSVIFEEPATALTVTHVAPNGMQSTRIFLSSRRRHTRCSRGWSSAVCSSDLALEKQLAAARLVAAHERADQRDQSDCIVEADHAEQRNGDVAAVVDSLEESPCGVPGERD